MVDEDRPARQEQPPASGDSDGSKPSDDTDPGVGEDVLSPEEILAMVTAQCGDASAAKDALEAAKAANQTSHQWADDALLWLAQRAELEPERQSLQQAMAISLQEAEDLTPSVPLVGWKTADLTKYFEKSTFLAQLESHRLALLAHGPLRPALVPLLDLERNCQRWYPGQGVKAVFTDLGQQCCELLHSSQSAASGQAAKSADQHISDGTRKRQTCSTSGPDPHRMRTRSSVSPGPSSQETVETAPQTTGARGGRAAGRAVSRGRMRGRGRGRAAAAAAAAAKLMSMSKEEDRAAAKEADSAAAQKGDQGQPAGTPEPDSCVTAELCSKLDKFMTDQLARLQAAVFAMPSTSGAAPPLFELAAKSQMDAMQDADVVIAHQGKRQHCATDENNPG